MIVRCPRCCLRYESDRPAVGSAVTEAFDGVCPHCRDAHVGVGRSFDEACADAVMRLRRRGQNEVWSIRSHCLYTADVADRDVPDVNLVHMVRLCLESSP